MAGSVKQVKESLENLKEKLPEPLSTYEYTMNIVISIGILVFTIVLIVYYVLSRKVKVQVLQSQTTGPSKPRFRKRDKVLFYGKKMLRKVRSFARHTYNDVSVTSRSTKKKRQLVMKLAKKILRIRREQSQPSLVIREPPPSLLEADWPEGEYEYRLPSEVMYMLRSVKVLGHFEKPLFLELCKYMESRFVPAGNYLFCQGDQDDSIYVVQQGKVRVFITEPDGSEHRVKEVNTGESIHSLLSILDVLTGHPQPYKTVSAIAMEDTTILRLPAVAFQIVLERFPESLVRVVQVIMVRLQRVTFMALHNYLGLSYELINPESQSDKSFSVHSIGISATGSPYKVPTPRENRTQSEPSERTIRIVNYEDDPATDKVFPEGQDNVKKQRSASLGGSLGKSSRSMGIPSTTGAAARPSPSDFDAACSRARVGVDLDDNPLVSGSPPVRSAVEELVPQGTPSRRNKKAVISDTINVIPSEGVAAHKLDNENILELATDDIVKLCGLQDDRLLKGKLFLRYISAGTELIRQGDQDASLIFVVTGSLQVLQQVIGNETEENIMFVVHPGEIVGSLAVLTGEPSFFTIRARTDARVVTISKQEFYGIMKEQPKIVLNIAHTVVKRMSSFVRQIDFALDWMSIEAGRALFRQGEHSDSIFIVLNGRLRSVVTLPDEKKELVGEYGRGELVGLVEVLTQSERATTVMAVRDTELAQIPDELLNMIKRKYPQIVTRLIHLLSQRILGSLKNRPNVSSILSEHPNKEPRPAVANLATVAVLPVTDDVPLSNVTLELQFALNAIGPTLRLTSDIIQRKLGVSAFDSANDYRLSSWLGQQEDIHRMVLYQCDYRLTPWTQRCVRQADCILIVAKFAQEPTLGKLEKQLETLSVRAQKELILLHKQDAETPKGTIAWLNLRGWLTTHHHLRCPKRVFSKKSNLQMMDMYKRLFQSTEPDKMSDFSRLARFLTGTAVGLVLGGGGARGSAHVGIIRAMQEMGVPIDIVGGVSIGSLMGGIWSEEKNVTRFTQRAREWSMDMNILWKKLIDLTYPETAMFTGASFNKSIEAVFHDRQIEDLWTPYFCITTDITASKMRVHTSGSLWRYVRASMSLSGYLPPLCDPVDGHLLLDGGYVNNLPADVIKSMGAQTIFAVDVGSQDETNLTNYGDTLSGWWLFWKKWNPWAEKISVPNMAEIQSRLAYVSCVRQLELVKGSDYCEYIRPPIDRYQTLQFGAFDEICEVGFNHGKTMFTAWAKTDLLRELFKEQSEGRLKPALHKTKVPREANFTDLAELISRIDKPRLRRNSRSHFEGIEFYISDSDDDSGEYVDLYDEELDGIEEHDEDDDDDDDDADSMSAISEPPMELDVNLPTEQRTRARSEGGSPPMSPTKNLTQEFPDLSADLPQPRRRRRSASPTEAADEMLQPEDD